MKFLRYLLLITSVTLLAQTKIVVLDADTHLPIEKCFIECGANKGVYTDITGTAILPKPANKIAIKHLGYKDWQGKPTDTIYLQPDIISLDGVDISNKSKSKILKILPSRSLNNLMPHNIGTGSRIDFDVQVGVFIPNEKPEKQKILKKILLRPTGYQTLDLTTGQHVVFEKAKYSAFKVNLYTAMPKVGIPLEPIFREDIIARLEPGKTWAEINLPENITMPAEGNFIVISAMSKDYYKENNYDVPSAPAFYRIGTSRDSNFKMYVKNIHEGFWKRDDWYWQSSSVYLAGFIAEILQ